MTASDLVTAGAVFRELHAEVEATAYEIAGQQLLDQLHRDAEHITPAALLDRGWLVIPERTQQ